MDEKYLGGHDTLPIPSYEEATSSRPSSSRALGPEEISDDAERQGLLRYTNRHDPASRNRYEPPTVESARSSLDLPSIDGSERGSVDNLRHELHQLEVEEPDNDNGSHRSLLTQRFSKHITNFTSSFSSFSLPSLRRYLPSISWPKINFESSNKIVILGRLFGVFLIVSVVYVLFASDVLSFTAHTPMGQVHDPESIRIYVQQNMNEHGDMQGYMDYITRYPHIAGTEGNYVLGEWVQELFKAAGLRNVNMERFDVYLNYPRDNGRKVAIIDPPDLRWEAKIEEELAYNAPPRQQTLVFHGHSASGNVTGPLIYANYGSREDFKRLEDDGISVKGSIALVRYYGTQGDRALKVKAAELAGAVGCIIYSDPAEDGFTKGPVWPDGRFMPEDGVQRGAVSLMSWVVGDVLSPGWASTPVEERRLTASESNGLVGIPSIPLAWRDAKPLLAALAGHGQKVPDTWRGAVPDVEYWTGDPSTSPTLLLTNLQDTETRQPIYNVLGELPGWEQPEKKIIVGAHRDAWCFGAADPGSGTAVMLEVVRIIGDLRSHDWAPLRTIQFASWDGEEYNLIGSTEHVENRLEDLRSNAVAYLNLDTAVSGLDFYASASPLFNHILLRILGRVSDPSTNRTLLAIWEERKSELAGLGAGSDYVAFQDIAGTSSIDMSFKGEHFPYHSCYDSMDWMTKFGDPDFLHHKAMGEILVLLILELADRPVIPFDLEAYATAVQKYIVGLEEWAEERGAPKPKPKIEEATGRVVGTEVDPSGWDLSKLKAAADEFTAEARAFHEWDRMWSEVVFGASGGFESNAMAIKRMAHNNRMSNFETHLLDLEPGGGLPAREQFKHVIFAPQAWSGYDEAYIPGVRDAIDNGDWKEAQRQVEKVARILGAAARKLNHN